MNNFKRKLLTPAMLVLMSAAQAASGQSTLPSTSSAKSSLTPDTAAVQSDGFSRYKTTKPRTSVPDPLAACSAAVDDLIATRRLAAALEAENASLNERLGSEKRMNAVLSELNETRKAEKAALEIALKTKNETIAAKDAVIAAQDKLIAALKPKRTSPWRRLGDILIGAAVVAILK